MNTKTKITSAIVFIAFSTWFYFTPHLAVSEMKSAAAKNDAAKLSGYVDFHALKESLKANLSAKLVSEAAKNESNGIGSLGLVMATAFINPMVDALVSPESLAMMMKGEKQQPSKRQKPTDSDSETTMAYESFNSFILNVKKKGVEEEPVSFVFNRDGLFSWKLASLRMPM